MNELLKMQRKHEQLSIRTYVHITYVLRITLPPPKKKLKLRKKTKEEKEKRIKSKDEYMT